MYNIKELRQRRADIQAAARTVIEGYQGAKREPSEDEDTQLNALNAELTELNATIEKTEARMDRERNLQVVGRASADAPEASKDPRGGFVSFGDFAMAVVEASRSGGNVDERLRLQGAAPSSYAREGSGQEGGYLVPHEFSTVVAELMLGFDALLPLTDNDNVQGNGMTFPADESTPWGTSGIRAYWLAEAALKQPTRPLFTGVTLRLHKMAALVPATDELLADASVLSTYIPRKMGESIQWKTNEAIINGTGAGQPLGILNSAALVTVAKESGQAADTIVVANLAKMYARCINPARAVWVINQDILPQLITLTLGNFPIFMPPTAGIANAPYGTLLGRPIMFSQNAKTLGDLGDIMLVDLQGYKTITKAGGIEYATSMHLWFDYDITAFRAVFRLDGKPWQQAAITPAYGGNTLSSFVTLAERA